MKMNNDPQFPRNSKLGPPEPRAQGDLIKLEVIVVRPPFTPYTGAVWTQPRRSLSSSARLDAWPVHELRFAMFMRHTLVLVASVSLLGSVALAQTSSYDNVDEFYNFIKLAASDAGYDTGSLPLVPSATYKQSVDAYFWGFPLQTTYRTQISFLKGTLKNFEF